MSDAREYPEAYSDTEYLPDYHQAQQVICPVCNGTGLAHADNKEMCAACGGSGLVEQVD